MWLHKAKQARSPGAVHGWDGAPKEDGQQKYKCHDITFSPSVNDSSRASSDSGTVANPDLFPRQFICHPAHMQLKDICACVCVCINTGTWACVRSQCGFSGVSVSWSHGRGTGLCSTSVWVPSFTCAHNADPQRQQVCEVSGARRATTCMSAPSSA